MQRCAESCFKSAIRYTFIFVCIKELLLHSKKGCFISKIYSIVFLILFLLLKHCSENANLKTNCKPRLFYEKQEDHKGVYFYEYTSSVLVLCFCSNLCATFSKQKQHMTL